jgi:D-aminoacyl-tRNA deacylase
MRAVVQRVAEASVTVDGETTGRIGHGLLVYLGAATGDGPSDIEYLVNKLAGLRVFTDAEGRMSLGPDEAGAELLVVSQFTLFGDLRRGRRPSFDGAAPPDVAENLYGAVVERLRARGLRVETGRFRADMRVHSVGVGPVTILLDSRKMF